MSTPLVSTIIPAYNSAASIRAAIESALAQTLNDQEVIVVDDASRDTTRDIAASIDDRRVRVVVREQNGGASAARNTGIAVSRGALIAFLDSDDQWLPEKLALQVPILQAVPRGIDVAFTGVEMHLIDHGVIRDQPFVAVEDWARRLAMGCNLSPGTTQLARRAVFDEVGPLDESLPRFEDWDWLLRYTRSGSVVGVVEPLARVYNRRARLGDVVALSADRFLTKHAATIQSLSPTDRREAITDLRLQVVGTYAFEGRFSALIPSVVAAFRQRPVHTLLRIATGARGVLPRLIARGRGGDVDATYPRL